MGKQTYAHVACVPSNGRKGRDGLPGFPSRYRGKCAKCGGSWERGDRITTAAMVQTETSEAEQTNEESEETETMSDSGDLGKAIFKAISGDLEQRLARVEAKATADDAIAAKIAELEARMSPQTIVVREATKTEVNVGVTHEAFETVLRWVSLGEHAWLTGPTGSGKTHLAHQVANALKVSFFYSGALWDAFGLSGYKDANGNYVRTLFREAYEHGGIFLLDEVDACEPSALLWLAGALANGHAAFPDGMVTKHESFVCLCAANTWGHGATQEYVGRMKQDAAFLNRFIQVAVDYDPKLERAICSNDSWYERVKEIRDRVTSRGLRVIISPRQTIRGAKALASGMPQAQVEREVLATCMTAEQWAQVGQ